MKKIKAFLFYALLCIGITNSFAQEAEAQQKITELNNLITQAENAGINSEIQKMTVRTAEVFLKYATYDANNVSANQELFELRFPIPGAGSPNAPATRPSRAQLAIDLPSITRNSIIDILDEGITQLTALLLPGAIIPAPVPVVDWANVSLSANTLVHEGKPVFLLDHTFKPRVSELTEFYGDLDGFFISLSHLTNNSGTIGLSNNINNQLNRKATGKIGSVFLGQNGIPSWLRTASNDPASKYYNLVTPNPLFTFFDVDHPEAKNLNSALLSFTVPKMIGKKYTELGYLLTNEPHWFTAEGSFDVVGISDFTKAKFVMWLTEKHTNISTLNSVWGSSYSSIQAAVTDYTFPVPLNIQGTPKWYDWMTFNQKRITNWFDFLHTEVKTYDVNATSHIKIIPSQWSDDNKHDHGLDIEALTEMTEIIGNDAGSDDSFGWGNRNQNPWSIKYDLNWRDSAMFFDFTRSVSPDKVIFNSENHNLSTGKFRDLYLKDDYIKAVHWLDFLHGTNAIRSWVWFRNADGSFQNRMYLGQNTSNEFNPRSANGYPGSTSQMPTALNAVTATVMELNAYSEDITALQVLRKPLRIFYSQTSVLGKSTHMDDLFDLYEALHFEGTPLGFATQKIIEKQDHTTWDAILVYDTPNVTSAEFDALQDYLDNGGTIIKDNISLLNNEYGVANNRILTSGAGQIISANSLENIKTAGLSLLDTKNKMPELVVDETNPLSKGVFWRTYEKTAGEYIISMVNVSRETSNINLSIRNSSDGVVVTDMLTGAIIPSSFTMAPEKVYLLKVVNENSLDKAQVLKFDRENVIVYPNPVKDILNIKHNFKTKTYQIIDVFGKVVKEASATNSISVADLSKGVYLLVTETATVKFIKE